MISGSRAMESGRSQRALDEETAWDEEWSALSDEPEDEEVWDEESLDEESLGNVAFLEAARRRPTRTRVSPVRRTPAPTFAGAPASVQIPTQRGPIQATLNERFVTPQQLTEAIRKLEENTAKNLADTKRELQRVEQSAISRDEQTRQRVTRQDKLINRHVKETKRAFGTLRRELSDVRQTSLMFALLDRPDEIQSLTLSSPPSSTSSTLSVASTQFKERSNLLPLLLLSGGLGTGGSDSNSLLLVLALAGGL